MRRRRFTSIISVLFFVLTIIGYTNSFAEPTFKNGSLLKDSSGTIYLIHSGQRSAFTSPAALEYYYGMKAWNKVIPVTDSLLKNIPTYGKVNLPDGALLKSPDDGTIYLFEDGKRRVIPGAGLFEALYGKEGWDKVVTINTSALNAISLGVPVQ